VVGMEWHRCNLRNDTLDFDPPGVMQRVRVFCGVFRRIVQSLPNASHLESRIVPSRSADGPHGDDPPAGAVSQAPKSSLLDAWTLASYVVQHSNAKHGIYECHDEVDRASACRDTIQLSRTAWSPPRLQRLIPKGPEKRG
jgi:hypothetical protein